MVPLHADVRFILTSLSSPRPDILAAAVATPRSLARVGTDGGDRSGSGVADDTDAWFVFEGTLSKEGSARLLRDKRKWGPAVSVLGMTLEENKQTKKSLVEPSQAGDAGWCYNSIPPLICPPFNQQIVLEGSN